VLDKQETASEDPSAHLLQHAEFVLATDLDGTFLGGTQRDRSALYDWIGEHRAHVGLIFVSGRDPEFIHDLCSGGEVPWPDFVIGDVGTTIARVTSDHQIRPIKALEAEISSRWNDAGPRVRAVLENHPGLTLQPTGFRYRVSYDLDPSQLKPSSVDTIKAMGLDVLISDDRYFDVLPAGVSKGPSLLRLLAHFSLAPQTVLAAGDTLNDLSMLRAGTPAVAVGGSEPALIKELPQSAQIYRAKAIGAAGILEAIRHFKLHPSLEKV